MVWQVNGTPDTLSIIGDTVTITDQISTKFNVILSHNLRDDVSPQGNFRVGNGSIDVAANYAFRQSRNGGADVTVPNASFFALENFTNNNPSAFSIIYVMNIASKEKLSINSSINQEVVGAATAPTRQVTAGKWDNTGVAFDQVQVVNTNTGEWDVGTNISALGTD